MTAAEYEKAYVRARNRWPTLIKSGIDEIKKAYAEAADMVTEAFLNASGLAAERLDAIEAQLRMSIGIIQTAINEQIPATVIAGKRLYDAIDESLLTSLFTGSQKVTAEGIHNLIVSVDSRLISATINRVYQDGYTLSTRAWQIGEDYQEQIFRLINSGTAQGKSIPDIARSIGDYTTGGISKLDKAYTQAKWGKVVVKNVDWRALRLVRSELGASMKVSAVLQGEQNPASLGLYDWVRVNTQQHDCVCPDLAAGSPYKSDEIPAQPHSACMCQIRARLRDLKDVTADIVRWNNGESVPDLDRWYAQYYQLAQ